MEGPLTLTWALVSGEASREEWRRGEAGVDTGMSSASLLHLPAHGKGLI